MKNYPLYIGAGIMLIVSLTTIIGSNIFFIYMAIQESSFLIAFLALTLIGFELIMLGAAMENHQTQKEMQERDAQMEKLEKIIKKYKS